MAVKYVKDFFFGPMTSVQRYAKGGHVTKVPAKAAASAKGMPAKAKPNAPATGAKRMESPPTVGKGQGYAKGGKAMPAKAKASAKGMPAKAKPNAAPSGAKRMESPPSRGKRQGYAEGGSVPGKKMDRLPTDSPPGRDYDLAPSKPFKGEYQGYAKGGRMRRYAEGGDIQDPRAMAIEPGDGAPRVQYNQYGEADPFEGRPVRYEGALERLPPEPEEPPEFLRPPVYEGTGPAAQAFMDRERALIDALTLTGVPATTTPMQRGFIEAPPTFPVATAQELKRPEPNDNAFFDSMRRLIEQEQARPARGYLNAAEGLSGIGRAMREGAMRADMMRRPGMPGERVAMYAKGGKVGKVMGEYKKGELHSGSKKGPLVKNPKQAIAIALSEARKSGAKIAKKEEGGLMASKPAVSKPKSVSVTKVTKTVSDGKDAALNERKMLEFLRSLSKDEVADMMEKRAMQAPAMDPDMPKYRKGGVARKGVPVHKAKAMYGGGKC